MCISYKNTYRKKNLTDVSSTDYRITTQHADRRNSRGIIGKSMVRRVNSKRTKTVTLHCKYHFFVYFDNCGFFVVPGIGNTEHTHHPKIGEGDFLFQLDC